MWKIFLQAHILSIGGDALRQPALYQLKSSIWDQQWYLYTHTQEGKKKGRFLHPMMQWLLIMGCMEILFLKIGCHYFWPSLSNSPFVSKHPYLYWSMTIDDDDNLLVAQWPRLMLLTWYTIDFFLIAWFSDCSWGNNLFFEHTKEGINLTPKMI
jgi:hypothetical protein